MRKEPRMNADLLIDFLRIALNNVNPIYYGQRIEEWMFENYGIHEKHTKRKQLEKYLSRYGERVFCYELYHQIRTLMDNYERDHPAQEDGPHVYFQGELRKEQIEGVIEYFDGVNGALQKEYIPDFLLHSSCWFFEINYHEAFAYHSVKFLTLPVDFLTGRTIALLLPCQLLAFAKES